MGSGRRRASPLVHGAVLLRVSGEHPSPRRISIRVALARKTAILASAIPAIAVRQGVAYLHQFATIPNDMVADETGVYLTVDDTRALFPASAALNKAITPRKFSLLTGAEEWSREFWTDASLAAPFGSFASMDFSGFASAQ